MERKDNGIYKVDSWEIRVGTHNGPSVARPVRPIRFFIIKLKSIRGRHSAAYNTWTNNEASKYQYRGQRPSTTQRARSRLQWDRCRDDTLEMFLMAWFIEQIKHLTWREFDAEWIRHARTRHRAGRELYSWAQWANSDGPVRFNSHHYHGERLD